MKPNFYILALLSLSAPTFAIENYPLEFADFFAERVETVEIFIAGEKSGINVDASVSYENFKLVDDQNNKIKLRDYLIEQGLNKKAIKDILTSLLAGIAANPGCDKELSVCVPKDIPNVAEFVYDFDAGRLKVFISSDMLADRGGELGYYDALRANNALVNWSEAYVYNDNKATRLTWNNYALLGLPLGYVALDTQYATAQDQFRIREAIYDLEIKGSRAIVGYQDQSRRALNSTDLLDYSADYSGISIAFGSSDNLLKGRDAKSQHIRFFAPQPGQLEIYRGTQLLATKIVQSGQQSISYSELPYGVYQVTLVLKQGTQILLQEQRKVVNTNHFSLHKGAWDHQIGLGWLDYELEQPWQNGGDSPNYYPKNQRGYGKLAVAYRPFESVLLASGVLLAEEEIGLQLGGNFAVGNGISLNYAGAVFDSGAWHYFGSLNLGVVDFSVEQTHTLVADPSIAQGLYGAKEALQWGVGVSGSLLGGTGFVNYFYNQQKGYDNRYYPSEIVNPTLAQSITNSLSLSWSRDVFGGTVGLSVSYSLDKNRPDAWSANVAWSRNFSSKLSGRFGVGFDQDGFVSNQNNLTYRHQADNWSASSTLGVQLGRDGANVDGSADIFGQTEIAKYNAYGYVNQTGDYSLSGSISGTQIISRNGIKLSSERGESFVGIAPQYKEQLPEGKISYNVQQDGKYWYRSTLATNESELLRLTPYQEVKFELDAEAYNIDIANGQYKEFILPGTYYHLDSLLYPLESQLFVFKDIFGEPVSQVKCIGDACKDLEQITPDGVFRLNYRAGASFKLVSAKRLCVYDPSDLNRPYVNASCLPGLDDEDRNTLVFEKNNENQTDKSDGLVYIGKYDANANAKQVLKKLGSVGLPSRVMNIGDEMYVYVQHQRQYSVAQQELLETLEAYVTYDIVNPNQLFSMR